MGGSWCSLPVASYGRCFLQALPQEVCAVVLDAVSFTEPLGLLQEADRFVQLVTRQIQPSEQVQSVAQLIVAIRLQRKLRIWGVTRYLMQPANQADFALPIFNRAGQVAPCFMHQRPAFFAEE